jgi:hypothetical protein
MRTDPVRIDPYPKDIHREGKKMSPFMSYEVAKGIVEDMRSAAERRRWWRRAEKEEVRPLPSWDAEVMNWSKAARTNNKWSVPDGMVDVCRSRFRRAHRQAVDS